MGILLLLTSGNKIVAQALEYFFHYVLGERGIYWMR
jgi:hypothetical protein